MTLRRWSVIAAGVAAVLGLAAVVIWAPLNVGTTRIVSEIDITRPPSEVYDYATTPATWPRWHPSSLGVSGDAGHSLQLGESVVEAFNVAGRRGQVVWRVVSREPGRLWRIEGTIDDHVAGVVTYTLEDRAGGTHFVRRFEYPSRTLLFALVNAITLRERVEAESQTAVQRLKSVLEGGPAWQIPR